MSRRKVPEPEKKVGWTISISPTLKKAAQDYSVEKRFANESEYVTGLIDRSLKRAGRLRRR